MKLEDQVCSLELAKQLKELGIKQESIFHWVKTDHLKKDYSVVMIYSENFDPNYIISAFTVAELGQLLPECLPGDGDLMMWNFMDGDKRIFGVDYCGSAHPACKAEKEADCRAMMLIYLIENGLVPK